MLYDRVAQRLINGLAREPKKKFIIERLKALGTMEFTRTIEPKQVKKRIKILEKCFSVMQCSEKKKKEGRFGCVFITKES